jgi:hypothetical protein
MTRRLIALVAAIFACLVVAMPASASVAPQPTCFPGAGPCNETDHYTQAAFPSMAIPSCGLPAVWIDVTGNGVQHFNVNQAQDFWETSTLEGAANISLLSVTFDTNHHPIFGPGAPYATGHLSTWFGISGNNQNYVVHDTGNLIATTVIGSPISFHFVDHASSIPPNSIPTFPNFGNAHTLFMKFSC